MARLKPQVTYGVLVCALLLLLGVVALLLRVLFGMSVKEDIEVVATEPQTPLIVDAKHGPESLDEDSEAQARQDPTPTPPPVEIPPDQPPETDTDATPDRLEPAPVPDTAPAAPAPKIVVHAPPPKRSGPAALELEGKRSAGVLVDMRGGLIAYPNRASSDAYRILEPGGEFEVGEKLETWDGGRAILQFSDSTLLYIGERSSVVIDAYSYVPQEPETSRLVIRLIDGDVRVQSGAIGKYSTDGLAIRSRMMRVDVPDADVAVHSLIDGDEIAVLGLEGRAPILVTTTRSGQALHDPATGKQLVTADADLRVNRITDSNKRVTVADGFPARAAPMTLSSARHFSAYTAFYPGAEYDAAIHSTISDIHIGRDRLDTTAPSLRP
ncbi:MAG: FecR domain-containing protein [Verrucomicrobia bacterium]|nr:FecR domain-containing protein [Verrucomicrobiota bacterium]MDA1087610.1 FecR domain-containing protein [Verrucomicrobiota bacterium]